MKATHWVILLLIVGAGVLARGLQLRGKAFEVDEAESSINALTVLDHGYPVDHYMGLPIYENTLTQHWPEHEEYEFRDSSYSNRGVAIYHGWLPLYAIAGAFALFGIEPDQPTQPIRVQHSVDDMTLRTVVPRLPSLVFSAGFLFLMFFAGKRMGGMAAGWTALFLAALSPGFVSMGVLARYYSATLMLSAACGLILWLIAKRGRWRDFLIYGVLLTLLFHTHVLSCAVLGVVFVLMIPAVLRHEGLVVKYLTCGVILAAGTLPWILWTGFPGSAVGLPRAWELMDLPSDLFMYSRQGTRTILLGIGVSCVLVVLTFHRRLPARLTAPFLPHRRTYALILIWYAVAFLAFSFLIPAISYFPQRMSLMLAVPKILGTAMLLSGMANLVSTRRAAAIAPIVSLLLLVVMRANTVWQFFPSGAGTGHILAEHFPKQEFRENTRVYAPPNFHLSLTYFLGLPVQSIAPVRKSFLDNHDGDVVFIEVLDFTSHWTEERVQELAEEAGETLSDSEAQSLALDLRTRSVREDLAERGAQMERPLEELPGFVPPEQDRRRAEQEAERNQWWENILTFKGFDIRNGTDAWRVYFYRFADPESRGGTSANFAQRVRTARAVVLPDLSCVVFHSPPRTGDPAPERIHKRNSIRH